MCIHRVRKVCLLPAYLWHQFLTASKLASYNLISIVVLIGPSSTHSWAMDAEVICFGPVKKGRLCCVVRSILLTVVLWYSRSREACCWLHFLELEKSRESSQVSHETQMCQNLEGLFGVCVFFNEKGMCPRNLFGLTLLRYWLPICTINIAEEQPWKLLFFLPLLNLLWVEH